MEQGVPQARAASPAKGPAASMSPPHLDYLDGWRGLAIAALLVGHFFPVPGINFGAVGVNLFFVLSGMLMARLLFVQATPLPRFYRRRVARIFPAVFVFLGLVTATRALGGGPLDWRELAGAATFTNNYFSHLGPTVMPFGHIWSLSVEEHSYVLLSLVALAARAGRLRAGVAVAVLALAAVTTGTWYELHYTGGELATGKWHHTEVSGFGIVASAAILLALRRHALPVLPLPAWLGMGAAILAMHWWSVPDALSLAAGVGLMALAVNLLEQAPPLLLRALALAPLRRLGLWSFSLYLWQQPFYFMVRRDGLHPLAGLALAFACGCASFYLLEQPARAWLNRHWGAPVPAGAAPART
jgi:peptidoglycan/LPS O-acetylase OafA/YrhL